MSSNSPMTKEQIKACREYLEIVELMRDWMLHERGFSPYNTRRIDLHFALLDAYGFESESDTLGVTDCIPEGMTPRELHDALMKLKEEKGRK